MKKFTSLAAGTLVVSAGLGLVSTSPALAATGTGQHSVTSSRPAAPSRVAPAGTLRTASTTHSVAPRRATTSTSSLSTGSTAYRTSSYRSTSYRSTSYAASSSTGSSSARTYSTSTSSNSAASSTSASTTTTSSSTSTAATTTTTSTSTTVSATGSCTLGSAANGTTCNQAIAYMLAQKTSGSTAWHNRCLGLVSQAYGGAFSGYGTAAQAASAVSAAGLMHTTSDLSSIPRGAVVWFSNSSGAGHVVISLGGGKAISSDVANGSIGAESGGVGVVDLSYFTNTWGQTLIGWSAPRA